MIAVIADDLTGAVEIAGIGLRYGLTVEVVTTVGQNTNVDLLVVATDTRSMPEQEAVATMTEITARLKALNPELLFKKTDSVLRGHVLAELNAHADVMRFKKTLLVPANPALKRTITDGQYFIKGLPIHLSNFAHDPDFPVSQSEIHSLLRCDKGEIAINTTDDNLPATGIIVGECAEASDLKKWAQKADRQTLLAGGSGFFAALLEAAGFLSKVNGTFAILEEPTLLVSGTTFEESREFIRNIKNSGTRVSYMPLHIVDLENPGENLLDNWADEIAALLTTQKKAVIAIAGIATAATNLREKTAAVVEKVFEKTSVKELLIEGGATASAIIKQLNLTRFTPVDELSTGVVRMKATAQEDLFLTLKPGSYNWPVMVWDK
ncbi:four-carbon acid sugar kinase family protein [Mucilaginibacter calamicampi]|uniref:Four-carbon acid sugar kinase family protein n=1 Tax=Mucilaginibacter calamicampi TaxID=1302352 RepID=A0ABW2YVZ6_9SPHI